MPIPEHGKEKTNLLNDKRVNDDKQVKEIVKEEDACEHTEHADAGTHGRSAAHEVLANVGSLGSEDRKKTESIDRAIAAAEADTQRKEKEREKDGKEGEKKEEKTWMAQTRENIKYTFISKETYDFY